MNADRAFSSTDACCVVWDADPRNTMPWNGSQLIKGMSVREWLRIPRKPITQTLGFFAAVSSEAYGHQRTIVMIGFATTRSAHSSGSCRTQDLPSCA